MTEIESLIRQAEYLKKRWQKPECLPKLSDRSWQEILDDAPPPQLNVKNL